MEIVKMARKDGSQSYHYYCGNCNRLLIIQDVGCNFCSNCGIHLIGWWDRAIENYRKEQDFGEKLFEYESGGEEDEES